MRTEAKILLQLLRTKRMRRSELERIIGISSPSMTYTLEKLRQFVEVSESAPSSVGKPPHELSISRDAWRILSVAVGRERIRAALFNGKGETLEALELKLKNALFEPSELARKLTEVLDKFYDYDAVGFAFSGSVRGERVDSKILKLKDFDVAKVLHLKSRNIPYVVVSDVEALAAYESKTTGKDCVFVINYGTGVGACYYEYHSLFTRDEYKNLPLGHLFAGSDELCYCGRRGCLETVATDFVALRAYKYEGLAFVDFIENEEEYMEDLRMIRNLYTTNPRLYDVLHEQIIRNLAMFVGNTSLLLGISELTVYGEGSSEYFVRKLGERVTDLFGDGVINVKFGSVADAVERGTSLLTAVALVKHLFTGTKGAARRGL